MALTKQQKEVALAVAVAVLLIVIAYFGHKYWTKHHTESKKGPFHGWRSQHYTDNPYNGQNYQCGKGHADSSRDRFTDAGHWPTIGTFGNLADTNPYGNYAGHADMWFPTYSEVNAYWTRS